jgi:hypothetical protein
MVAWLRRLIDCRCGHIGVAAILWFTADGKGNDRYSKICDSFFHVSNKSFVWQHVVDTRTYIFECCVITLGTCSILPMDSQKESADHEQNVRMCTRGDGQKMATNC